MLDDGTRADAKLLGYDLFEDTALLQVDPEPLGLRALPLGRARALRVGESVAVIGSPFENRSSLSTGVVSQLDRQIAAPGVCFRTTGVIQTDAAVNPGNSGGPLLDARGRVVGMVTAVNPDARGGVAYAVPIEAVERAYRALAAGRQVRYAWLGVSAATVTPALADGARPPGRARRPRARRSARAAPPSAPACARGRRRSRSPARPIRATATSSSPSARRRSPASATSTARSGRTARASGVDLHIVRGGDDKVVQVRLLPRPPSFANCS